MSFRLKITLTVLLVVATFLASFAGLMMRRDLLNGLAHAQENVRSQAEILESAISSALLVFDYGTVDTVAAQLSNAPGVAAVAVYSAHGDLITRHGILEAAESQAPRGVMRLVGHEALADGRLSRDVTGPTGVLGTFTISADLWELNERINASTIWKLKIALLGCLSVAATSWWIGAMLGRRIEMLTDGAGLIAEGNLDFRLRVRGSDEIARIGGAIDSLADSLIEGRSEAERQARTDALTGLLNRTGLVEALDQANMSGRPITVLHIDLDRFKLINDTRGHAAGDMVLRAIGARLRSVAAHAVALARNGGDEFLVLLDVDPESDIVQRTAQNIIDSIKQPVFYADTTLRVGASVGAAGLPPGPHEDETLERIIADADIALYQAKTGGRGQVATFDEAARAAREAEADLEWEVVEALRASEFIPFIQPQIDWQTGDIVGAEILARWQHPNKGVLSASQFLEGLRNAELAESIDDQVSEKALHWMAQRGQDRPVTISVNLSPAQMTRVGSATEFSDRIAAIGVDPAKVIVEVHEDVILDADGVVQENLNTLMARGHALELDDFGTGSASLQHLIQIRLDTLKIDRSFITDIDTDPDRRSIVAAIIGMARALGVRVLAEGVETEAERDTLVSLGCTVIQGFFFAEPMALEDYPAWANNWRAEFGHAAA